jgi:hypothetical protein
MQRQVEWAYNLGTEALQGVIPPKAYQRSRSEDYLSISELDTVVGNDVKKEPNISEGMKNLDLNV